MYCFFNVTVNCIYIVLFITFQQRLFPCVSQCCTAILFAVLAARVLFWLFLCRGKDLCRQPFGIPVEHARDENVVTMEFLCHVLVIRCCRRSLLMYS